MKKVKRILLWALLLWLIPTLITALLVPAFQKASPKLHPAPSIRGRGQEYVSVIDDNGEALVRRLQAIEAAQKEMVLTTYYFADDESGRDIMSALQAAANRGVHVRILIDGFCNFTGKIGRSDSFQALLASPNVEARIYNPVNLLFPFNENYRMHDKDLMADQLVYILGGRNTRNKSLGDYPGVPDADRDALVYCEEQNGSARELLSYFESVWDSGECKPIRHRRENPEAEQALRSHYVTLQKNIPEAFGPANFKSFTVPVNSVRLLVNPVEARNKSPLLWTELLALMGEGKDIEVQTPYIILSHRMHEQFSALTQGRKIKIITNAPESGANPMGCAELLNRKKHLLKTGFQLCEYARDRSAHVKTVVIDDHLSIIGSFNFDMRSAYLDTETMLLIDSPEINAALRKTNGQYLSCSRCSEQGKPESLGEYFPSPRMNAVKYGLYAVLRALIVPVRHLL